MLISSSLDTQHHRKQAMQMNTNMRFMRAVVCFVFLTLLTLNNALARGRSLAKVDAIHNGKVVLNLINEGRNIKLSMADIKALPQHTFFSKSPPGDHGHFLLNRNYYDVWNRTV